MKNYTAVISAVIAFAVTVLLGYVVIPYLRKLKFGQTILDIGPKWHKEKQGTPTMGGVMMMAGVIVALVLGYTISSISGERFSLELKDKYRLTVFLAGIIMALCMGFIGFVDDYIKVVKKRNLGLTARQKTFLQLLVSALYLITLSFSGMKTTYIPVIGDVNISSGLGLLFWPVALMFIYGFTNAVNLTDGLDGLASSVTLVVACAFMLASGFLGVISTNILSSSLAGACAGFLVWNAKPAKVFMGDTGSLALGGFVAATAYYLQMPLVLIIVAFIYLLEVVSVILQVGYFKATHGKRIFRMAPIHHHFELGGWSEVKVVAVFSIVTALLCLVTLWGLGA